MKNEMKIWFETGGSWLKVQQPEARNTGFRVSTGIFYLIYTNLSIPEKSPLRKVFSSHISVHHRIQ